MKTFTIAVAAAASVLGLAGSAQAQESALFRDAYGFDVGDATGRDFVDGLWVSLRVVQQQMIGGEDKIYARVEFCNNSGTEEWRGGISVAEDEPTEAHTSFRVAPGDCRTWSEWVLRNTTEIWVYARQSD